MSDAGGILLVIFRHAWTTLAALTIIIAMLGGLAQVMKLAGGRMIGSPMWVGEAIAGIVGVVIIALVGFLAIPAIVRSVTSNNAVLGCGPIAEIGQFSALLIGGVGSLRMLKSVFIAVASASIGASWTASRKLSVVATSTTMRAGRSARAQIMPDVVSTSPDWRPCVMTGRDEARLKPGMASPDAATNPVAAEDARKPRRVMPVAMSAPESVRPQGLYVT